MPKYYLNKNMQEKSGDMEVHADTCDYFPAEKNRIYIGEFDNAVEAVKAMREKIDGCYHCAKEAHTS